MNVEKSDFGTTKTVLDLLPKLTKTSCWILMDMKMLSTVQEQFVLTANHWTKVVQPMFSVCPRETVGGMSRELSLHRVRWTHF